MEIKENAKCNCCGFYGDVNEFTASFSMYHDMKCPKCGTTDIDTSEINKAWEARGEVYGYGDDNFLQYSFK